jgi:hypothetical protein
MQPQLPPLLASLLLLLLLPVLLLKPPSLPRRLPLLTPPTRSIPSLSTLSALRAFCPQLTVRLGGVAGTNPSLLSCRPVCVGVWLVTAAGCAAGERAALQLS